MKAKLQKNLGFGLIEVLIMAGVMALLFTMTSSYTRRGAQQILLYKEQARFVGEVMRARSLATQRIQGTEKICGYGIAFLSEKKFVLFKDLPSSGGVCTDYLYSGADSGEDIEVITLEGSAEIEYRNVSSVLFSAPEIKVYFDGRTAIDPAIITLGIPGQFNRSMTINSGGQIVVQ